MKMLLFTVFDSAAKLFLPPFEARTAEEAIRRFRTTVNSPESQINKYPEDYTLFEVGEFDQESGLLIPLATPHSLGVAITFLEQKVPVRYADSAEDAHVFVSTNDVKEV